MAKQVHDAPNQSANKYYASKQPSTIRRSRHETPTPIPTPPAADPHHRALEGVRSADLYYASTTRETKKAAKPAAASADVTSRVREAIQQAQQGIGSVVVFDSEAALRRARVQLDLAVSREQLTAEQAADVQFTLSTQSQRTEVAPTSEAVTDTVPEAVKEVLAPVPFETVTGGITKETLTEALQAMPRGLESLQPTVLTAEDAEVIEQHQDEGTALPPPALMSDDE